MAEPNPETGKPGWWEQVVGPGKPLDTDAYFVICTNVLGGCMGTTGPRSPHEDHPGQPWGTISPPVTINDMVRAQKRFIDHLDIDQLFAVIGGSMGGMQVLAWAAMYPEQVFAAVPVAAAAYHSAQNIAFHDIGRQAIAADPFFYGGRYWSEGVTPERGLAVARMTAHITYVSEAALTRKFGRKLQDRRRPFRRSATASRWRAICNIRAPASCGASTRIPISPSPARWICSILPPIMEAGCPMPSKAPATRFLLVSFISDWLFPTAQSRAIARALNHVAANVSFVEIKSDKGHDAFLLDEPDFHRTLRGFLSGCAEHAGLK